MRIERTGEIAPLTPRVEKFLCEALRGSNLDELQDPKERRADYSCLGGLLVVELKALEDDGSERVGNLADELRQRDDWPVFLGSAPIQSFLQNTDDPDGLQRRMLERIGRGVIKHLRKANRQLEAHARNYPRASCARALILINEDHEPYDPNTVGYVLWHAVRRMDGEQPFCPNVDFILYLTERHAQVIDGRVVFPVMTVEAKGAERDPWKSELAEFVASRWMKWNGHDDIGAPADPANFETIDHIPDVAPRSERWKTDYKRAPYLRSLNDEELRDRFDEITLLSMIDGLNAPPIPRSQQRFMSSIKAFGDLMYEMGERAIPVTQFPYEPLRAIAAARRLGLPATVEDYLLDMERKRDPETGIIAE